MNKLLFARDDGIAERKSRYVVLGKKVQNLDLHPLKIQTTAKVIVPMIALVEKLNLIKNREQ